MAKTKIYLILILALESIGCEEFTNNVREKRILINDPNYVLQNELQAMKTTIQELTSKLTNQENEISRLKSQMIALSSVEKTSTSAGVLYVRWGSNSCPSNGTDMLYSGFIGGSWWNYDGAASDYQCLVPDPNFTSKDPFITNGHVGHMYGGEYESNFYGTHSANEDAPCAVCISRQKSMQIMLPGRNTCYSGWKREYYGYLASNAYDYKAAGQFICVDESPDYVIGGATSEDGKLLHPVVTVCGSLKCPPYENNKAVTCVVCTK